MSILAIAGDIGGLAALIPVLENLKDEIIVVKHRDLPSKLEFNVKCIELEEAKERLIKKEVDSFIWTTSVSDIVPLKLARHAKASDIPVYCLLDNWMNYKMRMEIDGDKTFFPDSYFMMDELAKEEALKDGIPEENLLVTGQPALAKVAKRIVDREELRSRICKKFGVANNSKIISFVSEPAEQDQGSSKANPNFRGYTEKTVLKRFLKEVQALHKDFVIAILPHPREEVEGLKTVWDENANQLKGGILNDMTSNDVIKISDGVSGMASILLFESWLQGIPTISMQPELLRMDLKTLEKREGVVFLQNVSDWENKVGEWVKKVFNSKASDQQGLKSLELHVNAVEKISRLISRKKR